ncbi:MAG: UbiA family prenyltransferase [Bacteroidota bacterium]
MMAFGRIIKALRMAEVMLMTGFILVGAVFAVSDKGDVEWGSLLLLSVVSYLLMLSVYTANSWLGYSHDKQNQRLNAQLHFSKSFYLIFTIVFYLVSFAMCWWMNPDALPLHFMVFALWLMYSTPGFGKHLPVIGTVIHFLVAVVQFNFAYMFFSPLSEISVLISFYFALLISAGHLHHEIIDYEVDKMNEIKTSTVKWGIHNTKNVSFLIFVIAHLYWVVLFFQHVIDTFQLLVFGLGFIVHAVLFIRINAALEPDMKKRLKYRTMYRLVYLICGVVLTVKTLCF